MKILSDIGGTYVRFATFTGEEPENIRKYGVTDFSGFEDALSHYIDDAGLTGQPSVLIATAAFNDGGVWRFVNQNEWHISPDELTKTGWHVDHMVNDFEAATYGLLALQDDDLEIIKEGQADASATKCLIGPGTGLGLGYLIPSAGQGNHVQWTHGAHQPLACLTDEQWLVSQTMKRMNNEDIVPVFEDMVSGPGMYCIYKALCLISGVEPAAQTTAEIFEIQDSREKFDAIRIFHEFLGLFAAGAIISGHAYGGLYMTGGVLESIMNHGLFDTSAFMNAFKQDYVASVSRDLSAMPIYYVREPHLALKGLVVLSQR